MRLFASSQCVRLQGLPPALHAIKLSTHVGATLGVGLGPAVPPAAAAQHLPFEHNAPLHILRWVAPVIACFNLNLEGARKSS